MVGGWRRAAPERLIQLQSDCWQLCGVAIDLRPKREGTEHIEYASSPACAAAFHKLTRQGPAD